MSTSSNDPYPYRQPESAISRGAFVVVEGLDRAGKTTQVKLLCDKIYSLGHNVKTLRFPDRSTSIGKMIDSYLQSSLPMDDHAIHLLFSANRWEKAAWIEQTLAAGYNIICDRYTFSGAVYSAAKHNPKLSLQWAQSPDIGLPCPDLVVFLDLDPQETKKRGGFGEERYEKIEMQKKVRELFRDVGERVGEEMVAVDAGHSVEAVSQDIWRKLEKVIEHVAHGQRGKEVPKVAPWKGFET